MPFSRIWCVLENWLSNDEESKTNEKFYDLAAWIQAGSQYCGGEKVLPQGSFGATSSSFFERIIKFLATVPVKKEHEFMILLAPLF